MLTDGDTRVLIVDDFSLGRHILKAALVRFGFDNFIEAENGADALRIIQDQYSKGAPIKFVMSDLNMPTTSGLELLRALRATPEFKDLPFILATVETDQDRLKEIFNYDLVDILIKPLNAPATHQKLVTLLRKFKLISN